MVVKTDIAGLKIRNPVAHGAEDITTAGLQSATLRTGTITVNGDFLLLGHTLTRGHFLPSTM